MIRLEDIDENNWRTPLAVSEAQTRFVADGMKILARAYAYRNSRSRAFLILADETPVGMGLYYDCEELSAFIFSELLIDERYQRRGWGAMAVELVLREMQADGKYGKVILCYIEGNTVARDLYRSFGFRETDRDGDEIIMERKLT